MSDILDNTGLIVKTATEILNDFVNGYKDIYGTDINVDSNTADGQALNIYTQMNVDLRELIMEVYNSFNPDLVRGQLQDVRFKINNIERAGGTFTILPITIVADRTITLQGLDANFNDVNASSYGIQDNNGQQWFLVDTTTILAGTTILPFRSQNIGLVQPTVGTVTSQVTIVNGVISVNNPSAPTSLGVDQETDTAFALRREKSYEFKSQNSIDAMKAQLLALDGVNKAEVYNHDYTNYPTTPDADGIPLHYIWAIVEGGANSDIANVLYANSGGAGMVGAVNIPVVSASGQVLVMNFDRPIGIPLHIRFDLQETISGAIFDIASIKQYIADNLIYELAELAETSKPTTISSEAINANGGGGVCVNLEISTDNATWVDYIPSATKQDIFTIATTDITITEINLP